MYRQPPREVLDIESMDEQRIKHLIELEQHNMVDKYGCSFNTAYGDVIDCYGGGDFERARLNLMKRYGVQPMTWQKMMNM